MNIKLINEYIKRLTKKDIYIYSLKQGIHLKEEELNILYKYIKEQSNYFLNGGDTQILYELKQKLSPNTYKKIIELYNKYKNKL